MPVDPRRPPAGRIGDDVAWFKVSVMPSLMALIQRYGRTDGVGLPPESEPLGYVYRVLEAIVRDNSPRRQEPSAVGAEVDVAEATRLLRAAGHDLGEHYVRSLARTGRLGRARKVKGRWLVPRVEVEEFAALRQQDIDDQAERRAAGGPPDVRETPRRAAS